MDECKTLPSTRSAAARRASGVSAKNVRSCSAAKLFHSSLDLLIGSEYRVLRRLGSR